MFFIFDEVDIANYANKKSPYIHGKFPSKVLEKLEWTSRYIFEWFLNDTIKTNPDKCPFLSSLDMNTKISVTNFDTENTHSQKLLGFTFDCKLNFMIMFPIM